MPSRRSISRTGSRIARTASLSTCRSWRRSLPAMAIAGLYAGRGKAARAMMWRSAGRTSMGKIWKKGRGKLGFLQPLLGRWTAEANSEMGPVRCARSFEPVLGGSYVELDARLGFVEGGKVYEGEALISSRDDGKVPFWSFTPDRKGADGNAGQLAAPQPEAVG